ncbi:MAG: FprA family A-type flavoprotein [Kiritimatiellia bacterium]
MNREIVAGVHWVGFVDWNVRDFHGYVTERGSTYNSYLVRDRETALVDTVKAPYAAELLRNVAELVPLAEIRWVVCNHAEPDHSGSLPAVMAACPNATLVCDQKCRDILAIYYETANWKFRIVKTGDGLPLGQRTLEFIETPMTHWPESMATWIPQDRLLFSMDAFGQHYATSGRFDDEVNDAELFEEAKTYVANILMLYSMPVAKAVAAVRQLDPAIICPSHGVVWRSHVARMLDAYDRWDVCAPVSKVVVLYDTMWKSTEAMAEAIVQGAIAEGGPGLAVKLFHVRSTTGTKLATEILDAAAFAAGSPTLNGTLMPAVADALTYLKGLRPAHKAGFAFGSYGWGRGGPEEVEHYLQTMKVELLRPVLKLNYKPSAAGLDECREAGRLLARQALKVCPA